MKCETCGINLDENNFPVRMPCNVGLFRETNRLKTDKKVCPYETPEQQKKFMKMGKDEVVAGMLGTQHGGTAYDG